MLFTDLSELNWDVLYFLNRAGLSQLFVIIICNNSDHCHYKYLHCRLHYITLHYIYITYCRFYNMFIHLKYNIILQMKHFFFFLNFTTFLRHFKMCAFNVNRIYKIGHSSRSSSNQRSKETADQRCLLITISENGQKTNRKKRKIYKKKKRKNEKKKKKKMKEKKTRTTNVVRNAGCARSR